MSYTQKSLEKGQVELVFTVTPAEYQKDLELAAVRISERAAMKGFRPGKAPYNVVKEQIGEIKIMEEALDMIVRKTFFDAVKKEGLETVGGPKISLEKIAPGNDLVYKAVVSLFPKVELPDLEKIKVEIKESKVADKDVEDVLANLKKMQPKEVIKAGAAGKEDKVVVDMEMFIEKIPMEGGQAKDHQVYMSEDHYIPGFSAELVGLKKDDTKDFSLKFPKEHYQKQFAGKEVDFKIKVKDVFTLEYPELNDDFAKRLGQESVEKLRQTILTNLTEEAKKKDEQKQEIEILEKLIAETTFGEIPEDLILAEKEKIFHELKHDLEHQGIEIDKYLKDLKKTEEEMLKDFTDQAEKRVKAAMVSRQVAVQNKISADKKELADEIEQIKSAYKDNAQVEENLKRPEVLDTIAMAIQNRKVLAFLKEKALKK